MVDPLMPGPGSFVVAPRQTRAGAEFTVRIDTLGSSTCTRADGADIRIRGQFAEIIPYDRRAPAGAACTDDLAVHSREVRLRFAEAGDATIRVLAQPRMVDGLASHEVPVAVLP